MLFTWHVRNAAALPGLLPGFLRSGRGGEGRQLPGECCAEASSVIPGSHLAPDGWRLGQGWRRSCPLKPRGGGLLGNPGHGAVTCWHGRKGGFQPAFLHSVS